MYDPKYPIGQFEKIHPFGPEERKSAIEIIRSFPVLLQDLLLQVSGEDWARTYRTGSWNVAQLVHHCADANMNCFIRFKLALTEDNPAIAPYKENEWTLLEDYSKELVRASLEISKGLHARWSTLMEAMSDEDWERTFFHPAQEKSISLKDTLMYYSWHCRHHLKHMEIALNNK